MQGAEGRAQILEDVDAPTLSHPQKCHPQDTESKPWRSLYTELCHPKQYRATKSMLLQNKSDEKCDEQTHEQMQKKDDLIKATTPQGTKTLPTEKAFSNSFLYGICIHKRELKIDAVT